MVTNENIQLIKRLHLEMQMVLNNFNNLVEENNKLKTLYQQSQVEKQSAMKECEMLKEQLKTAKLAQSLLGKPDQKSQQLKRQINNYIKEIDRCLSILNKD